MYEADPDEAELAAFGLRLSDYASEAVEVWPENWEAFELFLYMRTQWRTGFGGAFGLDYSILYRKMDRMNLTPERYDELEAEIQILELEAIQVMQENKQQKT